MNIRYIGSKYKLNRWIFSIINQNISTENTVFLDACSGCGSVSKYAVNSGYKVISNDLMKFSSVILNGSIGLTKEQHNIALKKINKFNSFDNGINGYFYNNFCDESIPPRLYFTTKNAQLIDLFHKRINLIEDLKIKDYLLYCGLKAISRVSNVTGTQSAFLKKYQKRAKDPFKLNYENVIEGSISIFNRDILSLLNDSEFRRTYREDILYLDPPYNQRQYGPNYHLYETFVRNDNSQIKGLTGLRDWKNESYSDFCVKENCLQIFESIVKSSTAKSIFISYNSEGLLQKEDFKNLFPNIIIHQHTKQRYKSFKSDSFNKNVTEYLFEIQR